MNLYRAEGQFVRGRSACLFYVGLRSVRNRRRGAILPFDHEGAEFSFDCSCSSLFVIKYFVLWFNALAKVTASSKPDVINANGRLALDAWKNNLSTQYSTSHSMMDARIAGYDQALALHMPQSKTAPATLQPAPVMDKYSGLRLALNSYSTSHQRRAATRRMKPHADRLNTIHRSRVTPKGRLAGMLTPG